jgi:hypothetical protein
MKDMGMDHGSMGGMQTNHGSMPGMGHGSPGGVQMDHGSMPGMSHGGTGGMQTNHGSMPSMSYDTTGGMQMDHGSVPAGRGSTGHEVMPGMVGMADQGAAAKLEGSVGVDNVAMMPSERLNEPATASPRAGACSATPIYAPSSGATTLDNPSARSSCI